MFVEDTSDWKIPSDVLREVAGRRGLEFSFRSASVAKDGVTCLTIQGGVATATGSLDGPVRFEACRSHTRQGKNAPTIPVFRLLARLPFPRSLDIGLRVAPAGDIVALSVAGRAGFARRFTVTSEEVERARALVGPAGDHLDAALTAHGEVTVTDDGVFTRLSRQPPFYDVLELDGLVDSLVNARAAIAAVAATLPPPPLPPAALRLAEAARPTAEVKGHPPRLVDVVGTAAVSVSIVVGRSGWFAKVHVKPAESLPGAPVVVAESGFGWWHRVTALTSGRSELTTGDAAFDRRFAVRSSAARSLVELLDAPTRVALTCLDEIAPARLGPHGVTASGPVVEAQVPILVGAAYTIADRLGRAD